MFFKRLTALAFASHLTLGTICMMPMAMAANEPMPSGEAIENMTPLAPMSHDDCDHCAHQEEKKEPASSCAGHCLSQATTLNLANLAQESAQPIAAIPVGILAHDNLYEGSAPLQAINASPPLRLTESVVLRL